MPRADEERRAIVSTDVLTVLVLSKVDARHLDAIRAVDPRVRVLAPASPAQAEALAAQADVIVAWQIPPAVLDRAARLRWIHATAAGVDGLLSPAVLEGRVLLTSSVGIHTTVLPEHVMALVLALSRRLHAAVRLQVAHRWDRAACVGDEIEGRVMGILGLGAVGRALSRRAAAFGMRVIGTKRTPEAMPCVERVLPPEGTDQVLREADYLVVLLPLTRQTRGLIDARALALMKPSAMLINAGRGPVVVEEALIAALREGVIAGAALDVFEQEPLPATSPFYAMENVIITPHVSGASPAYFDRAIPLFCENLRRFLAESPMLNVVEPERGY